MRRHLILSLLCLMSLGAAARAQVYSIDWLTLDGGGGPSAGGSFSINGTLGQPDAGAMSGGGFAISGGFWSGVSTLGPTPVVLSIRLGGVNTVILTWPNPSTGYVLQQTANINGPGGGWVDVTQPQPPVVVGPNKEWTLPATGQFCMFRLRKL